VNCIHTLTRERLGLGCGLSLFVQLLTIPTSFPAVQTDQTFRRQSGTADLARHPRNLTVSHSPQSEAIEMRSPSDRTSRYFRISTSSLKVVLHDKRVIVTPAVYPRLVESLHFDIQSTGQKSHCVNTARRPSQCYVLIKQSDSPCPRQF
jgi:hypothetical protein